jgi:hypothetical protein
LNTWIVVCSVNSRRSIVRSTPIVATKIAASTVRTPNNSRFTIAYAVKPSRNATE